MVPSLLRGIYRLPPEILLLIFSEFRWVGSEPFVPVGSDCPWSQYIRMRKTLLLVCQAWYNVVLPSLYSLVYLYRIGQLPALVRSLEEGSSGNNRGIAHWVEHVRCEFFIPEVWELVYQKSMVELVKHCKNVRTLVHRPTWDDRIQYPLRSALLRLQLDDPFPRLTALTIGENVLTRASELRFPLSTFQQLSKLHLEIDGGPNDRGSHNGLLLPNLTTLICDFSSVDAYNNSKIIAHHWTLPKLQHLSVNLTWSWSPSLTRISTKPLEMLCSAHGGGLLSLRLDNRNNHTPFATNLFRLFNLSPKLTHITYSYDRVPLLKQPAGFRMPSLRTVEFFPEVISSYVTGPALDQHLAELTERSVFPSLDTIILLDPRLGVDETVDAGQLPLQYTESLRRWADILAGCGMRFLNNRRTPIKIVDAPEEKDANKSDGEENDENFVFEVDYDDTSSISGDSVSEERSSDASDPVFGIDADRSDDRSGSESGDDDGGRSASTSRIVPLQTQEAIEIYERTLEPRSKVSQFATAFKFILRLHNTELDIF